MNDQNSDLKYFYKHSCFSVFAINLYSSLTCWSLLIERLYSVKNFTGYQKTWWQLCASLLIYVLSLVFVLQGDWMSIHPAVSLKAYMYENTLHVS